MSIKEYQAYPDGEVECCVCGTHSEVTTDENGDDICFDCLFERQTEGYYDKE